MNIKNFKRRGLLASLILTLVFASLAVALPTFAESNPVSSIIHEVFSSGTELEKSSNTAAAENESVSINPENVSVAPVQPFFSAAQTCGVLDDFNRADSTNMGANWTEEFGDMQILNNRAAASVNHSRLIFNAATGGDRGCADVFAGSGLQFGGIYLKWTSTNDHLFVKVQDNDGNGSFERVFFTRENSLGFNLACNGGFLFSSPFSSARLYAYIDGTNFVLDVDTNFDGIVDQTQSCGGVPSKSGTKTGLGFYGQTAIDNFGIPPATLTVTKTADTNDGVCDADCSLREAIAAATSGDTIEFASPLFDVSQEIQLSGQLFINKNLTINGPGANLLILRQMTAGSRVLEIRDVTSASLSGMTITGGNIGFANGAGISAGYSTFPAPPDLTLNFSGLNITDNSCGGGGCGIAASSYNLNLSGSTVSNNSSGYCCGQGGVGGIQFTGATFNLINSTVSGNRSGNNNSTAAGGIWFNGTLHIINSTITDNEANGGSSGVNVNSGTMTVRNSIIAGNRNNTNMPDVTKTVNSTVVSRGNNIIGNAPAGIGFTSGSNGDLVGNSTSPFNPLLDALGDNGGSTPTHALLANSLAINNGNNCVTDLTCASNNPPFALTTDQRGVARVGNVDIGAFEFQPPADSTPPVITPNISGTLGNNGWYVSDVQISWSVTDDESTVSNQSGCDTQTVTSDTNGVTFTCSATSAGGSDSQNVTIKRDTTAPTITRTTLTTPNAAGWHRGGVTIGWECADNLSGATESFVVKFLSADGANQSQTGTCFDQAGNSASNTQTGINIDNTPPVITYDSRTMPNANGWNNTNVQVNWNCSDALSGAVNPTVSQTVSTEGANLSSTGTCTDVAGNTAQNTQTGIKIDKTAPSITFDSRTPANANGWNKTDVAVQWACADNLSGATSSSVTTVLSTEGANQSATGTCVDLAGNSAQNTQSGIKIDKTAPVITLDSRTAPNSAGWNNTNVFVQWNCSDALSGAINSSVSQTVSAEGANQSAAGVCSDVAGNTSSDTQSGINIDKTAPTITFDTRTAPNANGWNNTNVSINWNCADSGSGAVDQSVSQTVSSEGANLSSTGTCTDLAGNSVSNTQSGIKIDKTAPTIGFVSRTTPNANGWNNTDVTVNWSCGDALSGAVNPAVNQILTAEGINQSATGTCFDLAGNSGSNTQAGIKIDKTAPTLAPTVSPNPVLLNGAATASANASDILAGIASQNCALPNTSSVGFKSVVCTAVDLAGNSNSANAAYQVVYNFSGFFAPVQNLPATNLVTAGSIIDITFSLLGNQGTNVIAADYPASVQIPCEANVPGAMLEPTFGFGRNAFTFNSATNRYRYQWNTQFGWAGTCRMFVLKLTDGTEHFARFQFQ